MLRPSGAGVTAPPSRRLPGIGSHHSALPQTDEWLTPPHITDALELAGATFDLDPCSPVGHQWVPAREHLTAEEDGLHADWSGTVWCNPPYSQVEAWMARMAEHGNGFALVFARCETAWWFESVWPHASALLFLRGRLTFHHGDGTASKHNAGGPSVLVAYGRRPAAWLGLAARRLEGQLIVRHQGDLLLRTPPTP